MSEILAGQVVVSTRFTIRYADIRHVFDENGEPWFVAKDVCDYLEIKDSSQAYSRIDEESRGRYSIPTPSGNQDMVIVDEPGLYQLIFMSTKPEAKEFRRWVFRELLPELRKKGYYQLKRSRQSMLPSVEMKSVYAGRPVSPTRFGRQPFLDVLRERGITNDDAFRAMNELDLPGVPQLKTTALDQARGKSYVKPWMAVRAAAFLDMPVEDLFTEASRIRLPT